MSANMIPLSKLSAGDSTYPSPQIIEDRYIDDQKLLAVCREKFGSNYKLKVWLFHGDIAETQHWQ